MCDRGLNKVGLNKVAEVYILPKASDDCAASTAQLGFTTPISPRRFYPAPYLNPRKEHPT